MELEIENLSNINPINSRSTEYEESEQDIILEVEAEKEVEVEVPVKVKKSTTPKKATKKSEKTENLLEKESEIIISKSSKILEPRVSSRNKKITEEIELVIPLSTRAKKSKG